MSTSALRKFIRNVSVAFDGKRVFQRAAEHWRAAVNTLRKEARILAGRFHSLKLTNTIRNGRDVAFLGKLEAREFANLLRSAKSIEAFEGAVGTHLSLIARQAFRRLDDVAELHFPDTAILRRNGYVAAKRQDLVGRSIVRQGEKIRSAEALEHFVRGDASTLSRVNQLSKVASKTKKIIILGGVITALTVGISYLCRKAAKHAAENTGCFVYVNDNGTIRKCRALGCSCPLPESIDEKSVSSCSDDDLWSRMRLRNSECDKAGISPSGESFCVHCDWNENNPDSINYVDRESLPESAYVRCEKQDALDALNEMIGGTVDSAWDAVSSVGKQARSMFASSLQALPWVLGVIVCLVLASVVAVVWRFWRKGRSADANESDGQ